MSDVAVARTLRLLVVSNDSSYRRAASFLLSRRGFAVTEMPAVDVLAALREPEDTLADVIVVDGEGSLDRATWTAALVEELHPGIDVMLVGDDLDVAEARGIGRRTPVFHKWEGFDDLVEFLEDLRVPAQRAGSL